MDNTAIDAERLRKLTSELAEPFARAFATFIRMVAAESDHAERALPSGTSIAFEDLAPALKAELDALVDANERDPETPGVAFTEDTRAQFAAGRIRHVLTQQGIRQQDLAKRIGMEPSALSRVLKNPSRSKVETLQRIAQGLGIDIRELFGAG